MDYDVLIIGAGPGGIFTAYELARADRGLKLGVFELGRPLAQRKCPIDGKKVKSCVKCPVCSIMSGFGGAGAFSDGKYNITNQFGGTLYEYIGKEEALELMRYVDEINLSHGGEGTRLYSTANTHIKRMCLENGLHLLDAQVRHLGTDINYVVLENIFAELKDKVDFHFNTAVTAVEGLGLGILGIGLPDIAVWLSILLRSIYETALQYGFAYDTPRERLFILKMMEASMRTGEARLAVDREVEQLIRTAGEEPSEEALRQQIQRPSQAFAADMLPAKFVQGLPVVGVLGGAANPLYYRRVMGYVELKYRKRYLLRKL